MRRRTLILGETDFDSDSEGDTATTHVEDEHLSTCECDVCKLCKLLILHPPDFQDDIEATPEVSLVATDDSQRQAAPSKLDAV